MIATGRRKILNGYKYDHLFARSDGENILYKEVANVNDTLQLMKRVIKTTLEDTKKIAKILRAESPIITCQNIWNFCYNHFQYKKDRPFIEEIRRPTRAWRDRFTGIDCDCFTVTIGSLLHNCQIPFLIRVTAYDKSKGFEHVYPVAIIGNQQVILDCVVNRFNYQVPYKLKKDISMQLEFLNGFDDDDDEINGLDYNEYDDEINGVEQRQKRHAKQVQRRTERAVKATERQANNKPLQKIGKAIQKINRVNPITVTARAGILAAMKTNLFNIAGKLRFTYWTVEKANANNVDMLKFSKFIQTREKLEKFFVNAGGKAENLKKAILEGKGNRDNKVTLNGYSSLSGTHSDSHNLIDVIGEDLYRDEFSDYHQRQGINGFDGLGSAVATVGTVTGLLGTVAGILKSLGSLFKKGSKEEQQEVLQQNTAEKEQKESQINTDNLTKETVKQIEQSAPSDSLPAVVANDTDESEESVEPTSEIRKADVIPDTSDSKILEADDKKGAPEKKGIKQWITENPLKTTAIGLGILGAIYLGVKAYQGNKATAETEKSGVNGLNGVGQTKQIGGVKRRRKKRTNQSKNTAPKHGLQFTKVNYKNE